MAVIPPSGGGPGSIQEDAADLLVSTLASTGSYCGCFFSASESSLSSTVCSIVSSRGLGGGLESLCLGIAPSESSAP
ncbi:hypothetical protein SNOG_09816 [Parastagonospora nodorum SN15]|uniref:Uncharacterized protein n=1 Tax=Phaeosphaeria nodorum (strain SN15 / ATCC MYA-4574 / FGSC 10173) TaxID=321614 RepID=Q0UEJ8_PHANO|nr:hypothetical protein SNOG_09816 [Parastagonospora nodorum SN15]EAT83081.1 hypothetical protein SNOG_09816 [Parastagonospora nodorum SN15]